MRGRALAAPWRIEIQHVVAIAVFFWGILSASAELESCLEALLLSDTDYDQLLNRYPEYLIYLNRLSSQSNDSQYTRYGSFDKLPRSLQDNYRAFANQEGCINITDAFIGSGRHHSSRKDQLGQFCEQTKVSLALGGESKMFLRGHHNLPTAASGSPQLTSATRNDMDVPSSSSAATKERNLADSCNAFTRFSDLDNSGSLNKQEYLILVNLQADSILAQTYNDLPLSLQKTYDKLASPGDEIWLAKDNPIYRMLNVFQRNRVVHSSTICTEVISDIALVLSEVTMLVPNSGGKLTRCTQSYAPVFDINHDDSLSSEEYGTFAMAVARAPSGRSFLGLPEAVQNIFLAQYAREHPLAALLNSETSTNHSLQVSFQGICARTSDIVDAMRMAASVSPSSSLKAPPQDNSPLPMDNMQMPVPLNSLFQSSCTDNPQNYNLNVDIQIVFPDQEFAACDSEAQDSAINTNIQAALDENFATTVTDWQGKATFEPVVFDFDQEINNVEPFGDDDFFRGGIRNLAKLADYPVQRNLQTGTSVCPSRAAVECTADYCRWGCLIASTTNCGNPPSSTSNWTALASDVQARLASLGFDCLGIADQLQVVLVVDAPEGSNTTAPSGSATSPSGANTTNDVQTNTTATSASQANTTNSIQGNSTSASQSNSTSSPEGNTTTLPQSNATLSPQGNATNSSQGNTTAIPEGNVTSLGNATISPQGNVSNNPQGNATNSAQGNTTIAPETNSTEPPLSNTTLPSQSNTTSPQSNSTNTTLPIQGNATHVEPNSTLPPESNTTVSPQGNATNTTLPPQSNTTMPLNGNGTAPMPTSSPSNTTNGTLAPTIPSSNTTAPPTTPPNQSVAPTRPVNSTAPVQTPQPTLQPTTLPPVDTTAPTPEPTVPMNTTPPAPTPAPGPSQSVTVYNSWIMSNAVGQTAADLQSDAAAFNNIKAAYATLTDDTVAEMQAIRDVPLRLRRRRLAVSKEPGSSTVDRLEDSNCPAASPVNDKCVTAFGSATIVTDENTDVVSAEFTDKSQLAIDSGQLQQNLNEEDPGSLWLVEGSSTPVNPDDGVPDPPTDAPAGDRGGSDLNVGLVISGSVAAFLVILVCLLVILPACRKNRELEKAKKGALEAYREAEAKHKAAIRKKQERHDKEDKEDKSPSGPPWPKKNHDEGDNPYREEVEKLILQNCPNLLDEIDSLLHQYQGREEELVVMLEDFKNNESMLDGDSGVNDVELSSSSFESESESVDISSVDEDVPMAEIEVEEFGASAPKEEVAQNKGDDDKEKEKEEEIEEESSEVVEEDVVEETDDEEEDEEEEEEEEEEDEEVDTVSTLSNGIYIVSRSSHALEPPDDDCLQLRESRNTNAPDPPDDDIEVDSVWEKDAGLDPEDEIDESRSEPPAEAVGEPEPRLEPDDDTERRVDPEDGLEEDPCQGLEPTEDRPDPEDEPVEKERLELERQEAERLERVEQDRLEAERVIQELLAVEKVERERLEQEEQERPKDVEPVKEFDDDTDHETWLSSESSGEGYQVKWFQKNGCWHSEQAPIGEEDFSEGSDSTEYYSSDGSNSSYDEHRQEAQKAWKWVQDGKGWTKELVEDVEGQKNLPDEDNYFSSDSESDEDDGPGPTWVRKNGQWQQVLIDDAASLRYSDDSAE